jgi:hypothetical protein
MIKWFKKKVVSWVREEWNNSSVQEKQSAINTINTIGVTARKMENSQGMNFSIHQANGGYVMEHTTYDSHTDRRTCALHIITHEQDLGQSIAHIITLEMLRK